MKAVVAGGVVKYPAVTSSLVTSVPTIGVVPSGRGPLEYVNCAVGDSRAKPNPADTYGKTRARVGIS